MECKVDTIHEEDINEMMKSNKGSFVESDNQCRQISIGDLETATLQHQDDIDRTKMGLSIMLKNYLRPEINKTDLEVEGAREWLRQNPDISELERNIIKESEDFDVAVEKYNSKPALKFYEIWKKDAMALENNRLYKWRKSIHSMNDKLANEKENSVITPLAKQFINSYVKEKMAEQIDNQKRAQEIYLKRELLSTQRWEIAKISFAASQIKNRNKKIMMSGSIKNWYNIASQGE